MARKKRIDKWKVNKNKMKTRFFFLLVAFLLLIPISIHPIGGVSAQQPMPSDDEVNAIARQLFCPICENTPLDVCPTQACHDWRELIRQMLAQGKTPNEIKQYFVEHYGARVLSEPPLKGLSWFVYVVPPAAFLIGVFLLFRAFRLWKQSQQKSVTDSVSESEHIREHDEYASRLEEELRKRT
jgi:cytochrome c-type biogenesis protein CcmH